MAGAAQALNHRSNCFIKYCNANADLKKAFCGGKTCRHQVEVTRCENHWIKYGVREGGRKAKPTHCHSFCRENYQWGKVNPTVHNLKDYGWQLVRRVKAGTRWHPARDALSGTSSYNGHHFNENNHSGNRTFSRKFNKDKHTQFMFTSGNHHSWLIAARRTVTDVFGSNVQRRVQASSAKPKSYLARWYHRKGVHEDPWVSLHDHQWKGARSCIYGENNISIHPHGTIPRTQNGANVYIRDPSNCEHKWHLAKHHRMLHARAAEKARLARIRAHKLRVARARALALKIKREKAEAERKRKIAAALKKKRDAEKAKLATLHRATKAHKEAARRHTIAAGKYNKAKHAAALQIKALKALRVRQTVERKARLAAHKKRVAAHRRSVKAAAAKRVHHAKMHKMRTASLAQLRRKMATQNKKNKAQLAANKKRLAHITKHRAQAHAARVKFMRAEAASSKRQSKIFRAKKAAHAGRVKAFKKRSAHVKRSRNVAHARQMKALKAKKAALAKKNRSLSARRIAHAKKVRSFNHRAARQARNARRVKAARAKQAKIDRKRLAGRRAALTRKAKALRMRSTMLARRSRAMKRRNATLAKKARYLRVKNSALARRARSIKAQRSALSRRIRSFKAMRAQSPRKTVVLAAPACTTCGTAAAGTKILQKTVVNAQ